MLIQIDTPRIIQGAGKRDHQEDAFCPAENKLDTETRVFAICDGMGGHSHGEVASRIVADGLVNGYPEYMAANPDSEGFMRLLDSVYRQLEENPLCTDGVRKMGTTMAFAALTAKGLFLANLGDSPIFVLRPSDITDIIYRSTDHSLVFRLIKTQQLSPIQALTFDERNVLDKAIIPFRRETPSTCLVDDLKAGDYILMCTDGVTENLTDEMIRFIFAPYRSTNEIVELLYRHCRLSSDNHTALIIPIVDVIVTEEEQDTDTCMNLETMLPESAPASNDSEDAFRREAENCQTKVMGIITDPMGDGKEKQESSNVPCLGQVDYSSLKERTFKRDNLLTESIRHNEENKR